MGEYLRRDEHRLFARDGYVMACQINGGPVRVIRAVFELDVAPLRAAVRQDVPAEVQPLGENAGEGGKGRCGEAGIILRENIQHRCADDPGLSAFTPGIIPGCQGQAAGSRGVQLQHPYARVAVDPEIVIVSKGILIHGDGQAQPVGSGCPGGDGDGRGNGRGIRAQADPVLRDGIFTDLKGQVRPALRAADRRRADVQPVPAGIQTQRRHPKGGKETLPERDKIAQDRDPFGILRVREFHPVPVPLVFALEVRNRHCQPFALSHGIRIQRGIRLVQDVRGLTDGDRQGPGRDPLKLIHVRTGVVFLCDITGCELPDAAFGKAQVTDLIEAHEPVLIQEGALIPVRIAGEAGGHVEPRRFGGNRDKDRRSTVERDHDVRRFSVDRDHGGSHGSVGQGRRRQAGREQTESQKPFAELAHEWYLHSSCKRVMRKCVRETRFSFSVYPDFCNLIVTSTHKQKQCRTAFHSALLIRAQD